MLKFFPLFFFHFQNLELNQRVITLESSVSTYEKHIFELGQELELLKVDSCAEIGMLQEQIDENIARGGSVDFKISLLLSVMPHK